MTKPGVPTVLTVLTVMQGGFARDAVRNVLSLMIRVPARPSRAKVISIPSARRGVRVTQVAGWPASARGAATQPMSRSVYRGTDGCAATHPLFISIDKRKQIAYIAP